MGPRRTSAIVQSLANDPNRDHLGQQVGDFTQLYGHGCDRRRGRAPLKPYLGEINAGEDTRPAARAVRQAGLREPGRFGIGPNFKDRTSTPCSPGQASSACRAANITSRQCEDEGAPRRLPRLYRHHREARRPAWRRNRGRPHHRAETALSKVQWPAADRRDIDKIYNPMTRAKLTKLAPQFEWN